MDKLRQKFPTFSLLDESEKFVWLLSQEDCEVIKYQMGYQFQFQFNEKTKKNTETITACNRPEKGITGIF